MPYSTPPQVKKLVSNPVASRSDLVNLLHDLIEPLAEAQSTGGARIRIGHTGTHFDVGAADFEGFARALWGLTPLWVTEPDRPEFKTWRDRWIEGIKNGTDPEHEEYWGEVYTKDQRMVEMAAVGFSLCVAPKVFWEPLNEKQRNALQAWLKTGSDNPFPENNWRYFRVFLNLGLANVGASYDPQAIEDELNFMESFIGEHGFPADGVQPKCKGYDYYSHSFAITFYSIIYSKLRGHADPERAKRYRARAAANLPFVVHLYGTDGAAIPYGRSMIYRFACTAFFAALAFDDFDLPKPFTWGIIKGIVLRHIRWFTQKESIYHRDGTLTIGWAYPNTYLSEDYNSAQSPYWALKSFLILALPETHPFWAAEEAPYPQELLQNAYYPAPQWGQVMTHAAGHDFMLNSGAGLQWTTMRGVAAKYHKLCYSAQFGFSLPSGPHGLMGLAPDNTIAIRDISNAAADPSSPERWIARDSVEVYKVLEGGVVYSTWRPFNDTTVTTFLVPPSTTNTPYHIRLHHISSPRKLQTVDGGWAIHSMVRTSASPFSDRRMFELKEWNSKSHSYGRFQSGSSAIAHSSAGISGVIDLLGTSGEVRVIDADGTTNVISPRTVIPAVFNDVQGEKWLATKVWGVPFKSGSDEAGKWAAQWEKDTGKTYNDVADVVKEMGLEKVINVNNGQANGH